MDTSDLSPAYLTSLAAIGAGALMGDSNTTWVWVLGWIIIVLGLGLNVFSTLVIIQRLKGGALPAVLTGTHGPEGEPEEAEDAGPAHDIEPEPVTEAQPIVQAEANQATDEDRIFRPRPSGAPRVR